MNRIKYLKHVFRIESRLVDADGLPNFFLSPHDTVGKYERKHDTIFSAHKGTRISNKKFTNISTSPTASAIT